MATVRQYQQKLWKYGTFVCVKMGVDPDGSDKTTRVMTKATLTLMAVILKLIVDKGLITDGELDAAYIAAGNDLYPDEPVIPTES